MAKRKKKVVKDDSKFRGYKIEGHIYKVLQKTLKRVRKLSPKKVSESKLVKALIILSKKMPDADLLNTIKEI